MLKNRYQEILVGVGLMSLVRGIISRRRNQSTLLIDDKRFAVDSYPGLFLSELEIRSLLRVGDKYDVPELSDLRQFLVPAEVELVAETRVQLGRSPLSNIKEILRKYPELLDASDYDQVYAEQDEAFSKYFYEELARFEKQSHDTSLKPKAHSFDLQGPKWIKTFYQRFGDSLNQNYHQSKSLKFSGLLHLLSLSSEEKLKTHLGAEEIPFYFFRTFSELYRLQDFVLLSQLKRRLVLLGGDYKESTIQLWQFHENKFENLLLASFEGVIFGDRVLFFSHLPIEVPFRIQSPYGFFRKTELKPQKRITAPFPPSKLTYFTDLELLGSERPYRVMAWGPEFSYYQWPYPELPGSKPQFYDIDLREALEKDAITLPFQKGITETTPVGTVTMDLRPLKVDKKSLSAVLRPLPLNIVAHKDPVQGFEYWGPFKYRSMGLLALSYGVEGN